MQDKWETRETLFLRAEEDGAVEKTAAILRAGGLAAIPTETVYGLAADTFCPQAVASIFAAKGRPADNPLIVHIARREELASLVREIPPAAERLADAFWPGPLTMILPKAERVPDIVSAGLPTVAVRFPSHPAAQAVIRAAGVPLAAPSANRSGSPSPTTAQHVWEDLGGRIDAVLDGGPCEVGLESTVITLAGETPRLLRRDAVHLDVDVLVFAAEHVIAHIAADKVYPAALSFNFKRNAAGHFKIMLSIVIHIVTPLG